jgi:hypothetical protein
VQDGSGSAPARTMLGLRSAEHRVEIGGFGQQTVLNSEITKSAQCVHVHLGGERLDVHPIGELLLHIQEADEGLTHVVRIGLRVRKRLVHRRHEVGHQRCVALDDLSGGFRENVPAGVPFVEASFTDADVVRELFVRIWRDNEVNDFGGGLKRQRAGVRTVHLAEILATTEERE